MSLPLTATTALAQGVVNEHRRMESRILSQGVEYSIYLPPGYATSQRRYPVVYLMHGGGDGESADWFRYGRADRVLDVLIADGKLMPMIVVTPDGRRNHENTFNTYYMNDLDGAFRWEDMFIQEFMPYVEAQYRVIGGKPLRGIAGLSMGGYAALAYAFKYPELFAGAAALSAAFRTDAQIVGMDQHGYDRRYGMAWGMGLTGEARLNEAYRRYSVLDMVDTYPVETIKATPLYIDCGADDKFFDGNALLHQKLRDLGVAHRFMVREGGHDWDYWRSGLGEALLFLNARFQQ